MDSYQWIYQWIHGPSSEYMQRLGCVLTTIYFNNSTETKIQLQVTQRFKYATDYLKADSAFTIENYWTMINFRINSLLR